VNPNQFDVEQMVYVVIWTILGGTTRLYGPILGVVVLTAIDEVVLHAIGLPEVRAASLWGDSDRHHSVPAEGLGELVIRAAERWSINGGAAGARQPSPAE
jgi:branched-chain amino acid transport system permease protein